MVSANTQGQAVGTFDSLVTGNTIEKILDELRAMTKTVRGYIEASRRYNEQHHERRRLLIQAARSAHETLNWLSNDAGFITIMANAENLSARYGDDIGRLKSQFQEFVNFEKMLLNMSGFPADTIFEGYSRSIFDTDPLTRHISVASVRDSIQAMERICQEIEKMLKIRSSSDQRTDNGEKNDTEIASSILSDIPILGIQLAGNVLNVGLVEFCTSTRCIAHFRPS